MALTTGRHTGMRVIVLLAADVDREGAYELADKLEPLAEEIVGEGRSSIAVVGSDGMQEPRP